MRILYVYDKMPGIYQKYLLNLLATIKLKLNIKALAYDTDRGADYKVTRYGIQDYFQFLLYKLRISKYKSIDLKYMSKYDIVHLQHSYLWRKLEDFKKLKKAPNLIVTLRGGDTYVKPWLDDSWSQFYQNCEHIAAFVVMSEHQKQYLYHKWNVPLSKVHVIPISFGNHSNTQPKYPNTEKLRLVSAFRMTWEKNIEGTVRFAKMLKDKNIDFQYDLYGDGEDLGQLYYLVDKFDLKEQINLKGKVDNDLLKSNLIDYDFFVQLSLSEAFPTSVLEAQSVGLPCIVSNSGGLPEAIIPNETGICGDYYDLDYLVSETIALWKDRDKYFQFSTKAIQYVNKNYSLEVEVERTMKMYQDIFSKNHSL